MLTHLTNSVQIPVFIATKKNESMKNSKQLFYSALYFKDKQCCEAEKTFPHSNVAELFFY